MGSYSHLREIAVLPCLPAGLSVEDSYLQPVAPSFGLEYAMPNDALARTLGFLNISKRRFLDIVQDRRGINLTSAKAGQGSGTGAWRHRGEYAGDWRSMKVAHNLKLPALITDDQLVEMMENASYGGQLAIAGYVDADFCSPRQMSAVQLSGRFQIGIIDYIWGSGHSITFDGTLTVDLTQGQIGGAPGYPFDSVCDFCVDYFRFRTLASAELPKGRRFEAVPATPMALAA